MEETDLSRLFNEVLKNESITTHFQPIVDLRNADIIGYEALSRGPENHPLRNPVSLIKQAEKENSLWKLETLFREMVTSICLITARRFMCIIRMKRK